MFDLIREHGRSDATYSMIADKGYMSYAQRWGRIDVERPIADRILAQHGHTDTARRLFAEEGLHEETIQRAVTFYESQPSP